MSYSKQTPEQHSDPSALFLTGLVGVLGIICLGLWGLALYQAGYLPGIANFLGYTATPVVMNTSNLSCEELIKQAMRVSGNSCDHLGPNQVCYGNFTIQADLLPDSEHRFVTTGDVVDIEILQRLSTAPLDLQKNEWGIAIFSIIANLPHSLPGEAVKMMVFGNTTLGNNGLQDMQSFYFSSQLGKIACDKVPFDGIMITMPNGTGVRLSINGSDLMLMGNAGLKAYKNGNMEISLFSGTGSVTAIGVTQYFGAGQKVDVALGGANGTDAIGPPSPPGPLSDDELEVACALTGIGCSTSVIPTTDSQSAEATLNSNLTGTPIATSASTAVEGQTLTPGSNPTGTAGSNPAATATPKPVASSTPRPPAPTQVQPPPKSTKNTPPGQEKKTPRVEPTPRK